MLPKRDAVHATKDLDIRIVYGPGSILNRPHRFRLIGKRPWIQLLAP